MSRDMTLLLISPDQTRRRRFDVPSNCVALCVESYDRVFCNVPDPKSTNGQVIVIDLEPRDEEPNIWLG